MWEETWNVNQKTREKEQLSAVTFRLTDKNVDLSVSVHRHRDYRDKDGNHTMWLLSCYQAGISQHELKTNDIEEAKQKGVKLVQAKLKVLYELSLKMSGGENNG